MSKINSLPKGLQEYLGNTAMGSNPSILQEEVRPSVDLSQFLNVDKMRTISGSGLIITPTTGVNIRVPTGEIWQPLHVGCRFSTATPGDTLTILFEIWSGAASTQRTTVAMSPQITVKGSADTYGFGYTFPQPVWFPSEWGFAMLLGEANGGALSSSETLLMDIIYHRAKV